MPTRTPEMLAAVVFMELATEVAPDILVVAPVAEERVA